jgi:UTP--glucose-1-phosphate uridylyltransferase
VRQRNYTGIGSALLCARPLVGDEPFAVIVPDELIDAKPSAIGQVTRTYLSMKQPVIGARRATRDEFPTDVLRTGAALADRTHHVVRLERYTTPPQGELVSAGRYVFTPEIFEYLKRSAPAGSSDADLGDALRAFALERSLAACEIEGERFACSTKLGLLAANVHFGLKHPDLAASFDELLRKRMQVRQPATPPAFRREDAHTEFK